MSAAQIPLQIPLIVIGIELPALIPVQRKALVAERQQKRR